MSSTEGVKYHGRRRASLPAIKIDSASLLSGLNTNTRSPRNETSSNSPRNVQKPTRNNSGARSPGAARRFTSNHSSPRLTPPEHSKSKGSSRQPKSQGLDHSGGSIENRKITGTKDPQSSSSTDDNSRTPSPQIDPGARYNRGRRHSIDVIVLPPGQNKRLRSPQPGPEGDTRQVWEALCRDSDPHNFNAHEYDKETLPHGSSIFQSVLHELDEESEEDESDNSDGVSRGDSSKATHHRQKGRSQTGGRATRTTPATSSHTRHVRFGGKTKK